MVLSNTINGSDLTMELFLWKKFQEILVDYKSLEYEKSIKLQRRK